MSILEVPLKRRAVLSGYGVHIGGFSCGISPRQTIPIPCLIGRLNEHLGHGRSTESAYFYPGVIDNKFYPGINLAIHK
ncbi:hypothetical protein SAMN02746095_00416 [Acidocella aminolytica 101 = DSM 11237]|nr:hypothetical protein SAMN02746095_00416 [Acidocella aminolytica 101 = DSM 11237]